MYQRVGSAAYKADLKNTEDLVELLDHPERELKFIHIAGTNGKGSCSHMIASILQEAGYTTGLYTSPHLLDFRERIKVNGQMILEKTVIEFVDRFEANMAELQPSFFEWTFGLALHHFREAACDLVVLETGMGGRLDSTNVVTPILSAITNVSMDHSQFLGDTVEKIAGEKSGIIKHGIPVVLGEMDHRAEEVMLGQAKTKGSPVHFSRDVRSWHPSDLQGKIQEKNIRLVTRAIDILAPQLSISEEALRDGLARVVANTGLRGRLETISEDPFILADIAHNEDAIRILVEEIEDFDRPVHCVLGTVNDKELDKILSLLPLGWTYYFTKADIPRALDVSELAQKADIRGLQGQKYEGVSDAVEAARKAMAANEMLVVTGSAFVVADFLSHLAK